MRSHWSDLPHQARTATLGLAMAWVTLLSWRVLSADFAEVAMPLLFIGLLVSLGGVVARAWGIRLWAVFLIQVLVMALLVVGTVTGSLLPSPGNLSVFLGILADGAESARKYAAPVPTSVSIAPVHPLLLVGGACVVLAVDLLAVALRRVPLSGLALLAAYTLPVTVTARPVSWWVFAAAAGLFLALLHRQHGDQLSRWGRTAEDERSAFSVRTGAVGTTAFGLGGAAVALALAVPIAVPTLDVRLFEGAGPGKREVTVEDPMADLRRDLSRGQNVPLLQLTTDDPDPDYLRVAVLTRFADGRWSPGDRAIPDDQTATGELPGLDGVSTSLPRKEYRYQVRATTDFNSTWLPTMPQTTRINAGSDWRYDLSTRDFIAARDDVTTAGRGWQFSGVDLTYDPVSMNRAVSGGGAVRSIYTEVPASVSNTVRRLAATVTADAPTRYQKAQVLQQWFREDGGFRYDTEAVDADDDAADLDAFLDEDTGRVGYCEQFAASMAIMARSLGIPSRVAVGFLEPRRLGDGLFEYWAWDLHAWPELYFRGSGWVRFEPTPGTRAEQTPPYTTAELREIAPTSSPSATRSDQQLPERGLSPGDEAAAQDQGSSLPWGVVVPALLFALLVVVLLLVPRLLRRSRRVRRLDGGIEDAWAELRATVVDLGHAWPEGRSPRRTGHRLAGLLATPVATSDRPDRPRRGRDQAPEAAAALDRLVARLERSRYARQAGSPDTDAVRGDVELVEQSLTAGVAPSAVRRATWWPRSVVSLRRDRRRWTGSAAGPKPEPTPQVEELVG